MSYVCMSRVDELTTAVLADLLRFAPLCERKFCGILRSYPTSIRWIRDTGSQEGQAPEDCSPKLDRIDS